MKLQSFLAGAGTAVALVVLVGAGSYLSSQLNANQIADGTVSNAEFQCINSLSSNAQTQINGKAATSHAHAATDITSGTLSTARLPTGIDAANIGSGSISNAEFDYLNGVTSGIQSQINAKSTSGTTLAAYGITDAQGLDSDLTSIAGLGSAADKGLYTTGLHTWAEFSLPSAARTAIASLPDISGNAGTATALATARAINGVNFDGTGPITVTAAAGTLTGATLNSGVTASSLTSLGTIATGVWHGTALGTLYGGTGVDLSASGSATAFLAEDASHVVSARSLVAGDIPSLDAAIITTGKVGLANGGTGADLSGTGGTSQVLTQTSVGGNVGVARLAASDLSDGTTGSVKVVLSTSPILVTPTLGVASATSVNKVAITAPATGSTLTIADGKTATVSNTLTFTGTDTSSIAFGGGGTAAYTGTDLGQFASTSSATLKTLISDETGTGGVLVFSTSPTFTTPLLGTPTSGVLTNCTGTASGLTAGTVTTNANLTGNVTSVGNATTIAAGVVTNAMLAGSIDLTSKVTGTLPIANGGTGTTTGSVDGWTYLIQAADQDVNSSALNASNTFTFGVTSGKSYIVEITGSVASGSASDFIWNIDLSDGSSTMLGFCQFQTTTTALGVGNSLVTVSTVNTFSANQACGTPADATQPVPFHMLYAFKSSGTTTWRFKFGAVGYHCIMHGGTILRYKQVD